MRLPLRVAPLRRRLEPRRQILPLRLRRRRRSARGPCALPPLDLGARRGLRLVGQGLEAVGTRVVVSSLKD